MKKVLVIGATGLVGSRFLKLATGKLDMIGVDEKTLDITDKSSVENYFTNNEFDSVLNFAAITNVDGAEKERGDTNGFTWKLNVEGPSNLIELCKIKNKFLVQISTDFVFPGSEENPGPYSEDAKLPSEDAGIGWYGWTKNRVENKLSESGTRNAVVRIAYPFYKELFEQKLDFAKNYIKQIGRAHV